jgi:hypothetical protein
MDYLYEFRATKRRLEAVRLLPLDELRDRRGFRSLYGYGPEAVEHIRTTQSTSDMAGLPVASNVLFVDFDDRPDDAHRMADELRAYDWVKFDSGGRSIHLHIRIDSMYGGEVPQIQKTWMKEHFPTADMSIYRTSGIYRLTGTFHESNPGHCKHVIEVNQPDKALKIEVDRAKLPVWTPVVDKPDEELNEILMLLVTTYVDKGTTGRNYHAFKICKVCAKLGLNSYETIKIIERWNKQFCNPPLQAGSIESTIISVYRGAA